MTATDISVQIRDARPDECAAIAALTIAAYEQYATIMTASAWRGLEAAVRSALATNAPVERIVAAQDGKLVGSVQLYPADTNAYADTDAPNACPEIRVLAVAPAARGQGAARALMDECARRARQSGAQALGLHTSDSLTIAVQMYERMGFRRFPADDFQPDGAELVKAYRLALREE